MDEGTLAGILVGSGLTGLVSAQFALRLRRERRGERALARSVARGADLPESLHPVIDPDVCIGSLTCLKACPEGDILGVVDGAARLVEASNCIGHGRCAASCPVHAIKLVFGTAERGVDLPEVDGRFESSRPGVHVVGELAGMGLIRNALEQGAQCAGYLAEALGSPEPGGSRSDAVVIGAGPAGVSCALGLRSRGFSVRILDRGRFGGGIARYAGPGLASSGPLELPGAGALRRAVASPEELLAFFEKAMAAAGQRVEEGVAVSGLSGEDGAFAVETAEGPVAARKVVLATGRVAGEPALRFLQALGVQVRRLHGEEQVVARPGAQRLAQLLSRDRASRRTWWRWMALLGAVGLVLLAGLLWAGHTYYPLPRRLRLQSPLHPSLKPASSLGLTIGIAASAVMLTNFLYALRKRWSVLAGVGNLSDWLDLHVFVGVMSPLVIAFHAAFQAANPMAATTYASLGIVVTTGLVGRYFYGLVPGSGGRSLKLAELLGQIARLEDRLRPLVAGGGDRAPLEALLAAASAAPSQAPLGVQLARSAFEAAALRLRLRAALQALSPDERPAVRDGLLRLRRLRAQAGYFAGIKRLMRAWRSLHASLAVLLVVVLLAHVALSIYLGYFPRSR